VIVFGSEWTRKVHRPSLSGRLVRAFQLGSGKIVEFREYMDALARRSPTLSPSGLSDLISRPQTR
jgi:hypothetical protein